MFKWMVLGVLLVVATPTMAQQTVCYDHKLFVEFLKKRYSEVLVGIGVTTSGTLIGVYASKDGGTWTIVHTDVDSVACGIAAGKDWQTITPVHGERM